MHAAQPTRARVLQVLWFPFFFAAAFSALLLAAFADPTPHALPVAVVGTGADARQTASDLDAALAHVHAGGFHVTTRAQPTDAARDVRAGRLAAALVLPADPTDEARLLVATGAGATRAKYVDAALVTFLATDAGHQGGDVPSADVTLVDLAPVAPHDTSGVSLFFFSLPLLLVGLITSIVLLQLAAWPLRRKLATVAATGAFATAFTFALATALQVVPVRWWLLPLGFALTQVVGWLTVTLPVLVKHFFVPVAMTFVLVLGIPTAGSTVSPDMLPTPLRLAHDVLPFGAYTDLARAVTYLDGAPVARPLAVLVGWALVAVAVVTTAARRTARVRTTAAVAAAR